MDPYEYHESSTDDDLLPVVNERDEVIGEATRREIHLRKLLHRAVHIVVLNQSDQVVLQKRSMMKDSHPGWWDISVGGHVDAGEEYDAAAVRELREELGLEGEPREVARRPATESSGWEFVRVYEFVTPSEPMPDVSEIDELVWISVEELLVLGHSEPDRTGWRITGSGLASLHAWAEATGRR